MMAESTTVESLDAPRRDASVEKHEPTTVTEDVSDRGYSRLSTTMMVIFSGLAIGLAHFLSPAQDSETDAQ